MRIRLMPYANNKDSDQPAWMRSLISIFIINYIDSTSNIDSITRISRL